MSIADELQKLEELRRTGALSDEEFAKAKASVISNADAISAPPVPPVPPEALAAEKERQTRQWATLLHLSLLSGFLVPLAGFVVPVLIWQLKKDELPGLDPHGKMVINWILSLLLYGVLSLLLLIVLIGIPLLLALWVIAIVFPIIGTIKANEGVVWKYPLTIAFIK
jgi:uncharacterized Tic20 family protein